MNNLSIRLKERRRELGLSQIKLAKKVGLTQGAIAQLEIGRNQNTIKLIELAVALNTTPEWLLYGTGNPSSDCTSKKTEPNNFIKIQDIPFKFDVEFLERIAPNKKSLVGYEQADDSMSPTINSSDYIIYDTSDKIIVENCIFIIKRNSKHLVRRIVFDKNGVITYRCDNLEKVKYPDTYTLQNDKILGRVIWAGGYKQFK